MINYHMHINYSIDATATLGDYCKRAAELNFKEICITNHQEWVSVADGTYDFALTEDKWKKVADEIKKARIAEPHLKIKLGVELGYFPEYKNEIAQFVRRWLFDYVVGSIHFVNGILIADERHQINPKNHIQWYRDYFTVLKEMVRSMDFDCIAHFDIVKKTSPKVGFLEYKDIIEDIIMLMKEKNIGLELNTMGWGYKCKEQFPCIEILQLMHDRGIKKVTIGSDSHRVEDFDYKLKEGLDLLRKIGFKEICTFTQRKPEFHPI